MKMVKYMIFALITQSNLIWSNTLVKWVNLGLSIEFFFIIGLGNLIVNQLKTKGKVNT